MFEGERRERCVGDEVAGDLVAGDELAEHSVVLGSGVWDPGDRIGETVGDALPGDGRVQGLSAGPGVSRDAQERNEALPRHSHPARSVELLGQPGDSDLVVGASFVDGVEKQVCVEQHQRAVGPSSVSIASLTFAKSMPVPRSCVF